MKNLGWKSLPALALCVLGCMARGQTDANPACTLPSPAFTTNAANIFDDRQEQDLGDALAEFFESDMKIAAPAPDDQLTRIGERLLATLPPTGIHYRFRVYDSGEVNGFSLAGGRVYISRKLIAAVKNEDELAGVLAHEIGHLSTHQTAIEMTRMFKLQLGVTEVGDRADVFAKVHKLLSTPVKEDAPEDNEEKHQLVADHVALYAVVRAGYAPESFASFLNESMMNKGKTGNWLTDVFGLTHEESQRYRRALKLIGELPAGCSRKPPHASDAFLAWQRSVVEERVQLTAEGVRGDRPLKLEPPLRPSLWRIRFSPNGNYLLAQDEGSVTVVDRVQAKELFRFDAPDAERAQFTPDSQSVVFHDGQLRVEKWSVATGQRTSVNELVVFDGCSQTLLSPDGKTLVCAKVDLSQSPPRIGLRLIDVETGKPFYDKPGFFELNYYAGYSNTLTFVIGALAGVKMAEMEISPDGKYLLVAVGDRVLAYDLENRREISLGGKLKGISETKMAFVGPDDLFMTGELKSDRLRRGQVFSFPDGKPLKEIEIGDQDVEGVTAGQMLVVSPLEDYTVGIVDLNDGKFVGASKLSTMDAWGDWIAAEDPMGGLEIARSGVAGVVRIPLPLGPLPNARAAAFSPDGKFLTVSMRNRAAIWDLETGLQVRLLRPFRSVWIDGDDRLWGQFPKFAKRDAQELRTALAQDDAKDLGKFDDLDLQYRDLQIRFTPMGKDKITDRHATMEVKKMETQTMAWTRDYPHEAPVCWPAEDNRLVLAWDLSTAGAKDELKNRPQLLEQAEALKDHKKGLLLETVVPETGAPLEQVALPEVDLSGGWNDERFARVSGEFVLVRGEHGNTVIYRLDTGAKVGEFFGAPVATDAGSGLIAARNREDEILLVDERTGKELERFSLGSPVRLARIVGGNTLLVLTADQVVHRLPVTE
ncbi:MAG: M48 family metalloprotease [Terracidiphilus sp.]